MAAPPAADAEQLLLSGRLGSVEAQLLLGKVYSQWRGHTADALAVYDALTEVRVCGWGSLGRAAWRGLVGV